MDEPLGINTTSGKSYNVIIADDSYTQRAVLKLFLLASKFNILADLESGEAVLDFLKYSAIIPDVLFLDYNMETGNALEIIKEIRPVHPYIKIVLITGNKDKGLIGELLHLKINAYILKPISKIILDERLIQLLGRKDLVPQSKIVSKKNPIKLEDLVIPPLPDVVHKVLLFESNSVSGSSDLEQIILPDKSVCADLLRVANSSYYARIKKIQTVKDAITLLGLKTVKQIVIYQSQRNFSKDLVYSEIFKKHLLELPILSALISFDLSVPLGLKTLQEELLLLAMMRKIGMTILAINNSKTYTDILGQVEHSPIELYKIEEEVFSVNHVEVGLFVFKAWNMPSLFLTMMKNQLFTKEEFTFTSNFDRILRASEILGRNILNIPLVESELEICKAILNHYKAPENTMDVFNSGYYESIQSHPFFDAI